MTDARRLTALDGLRGAAAVVVLVQHAMLTAPLLSGVYYAYLNLPVPASGSLEWWWVYSPLHLAWGGAEAVYVFFVLSGFVLVQPFLAGRQTWTEYYPRRLVRLYLPVLVAVALAIAVLPIAGSISGSGLSWWVGLHQDAVSAKSIVQSTTLVFGTGMLDSPLWSLKWEVVFSILLPVYVLAARRLPSSRWAVPAALLAMPVIVASGVRLEQKSLIYLPMFGLGVVLAVAHRHGMFRLGRVGSGAIAGAGLLLITTTWSLPAVAEWITQPLEVVGAGLLVTLFLVCRTARRVGDGRVLQWLGTRSFSLYLVHEPIVVVVAVRLADLNAAGVLLVSAVLSLLVASVFYRLVERPSIRLSRSVGRYWLARSSRPDLAPPVTATR